LKIDFSRNQDEVENHLSCQLESFAYLWCCNLPPWSIWLFTFILFINRHGLLHNIRSWKSIKHAHKM